MIYNSHPDVLELFSDKPFLKVCAPMVRYSKLQFRTLVRKYRCDVCFTPMILADSFCKSSFARASEFTTNLNDAPLIAQFAANTASDFVMAASLVSPFCSGVDLNCGCPQSWARKQGIGCALLDTPDVIFDMVRQCRNQVTRPFTVSVKTRILSDLRKTVEICRNLEKAGVSFLTVHARTSSQLTGDINLESLRHIKDSTNIPIIANGGIKTLDDCFVLYNETKCKGVMVANGLLSNPTLFAGSNITTLECIQDWLDICYNSTLTSEQHVSFYNNEVNAVPCISEKPNNLSFQCFHHHLVFMLEKLLAKRKRKVFNNLQKFSEVLEFIHSEFGLLPRLFTPEEFTSHIPLQLHYGDYTMVSSKSTPGCIKNENTDGVQIYDSQNNGYYFEKKVKGGDFTDDSQCNLSALFFEND